MSWRMIRIGDKVVAVLEIPPADTEGHLAGTLACLQLLYSDPLDIEQDDGFLIVTRVRT